MALLIHIVYRHLVSFTQNFCRSNNCPDCRSTIHHAKRVYLNVRSSAFYGKQSPRTVVHTKKLETINELNRRKIADLTVTGQNMKKELDALKHTVNEMSRMNLLQVGRHTIEVRQLESIIEFGRNKCRDMRNLAKLKDRTINELNTALKLREMRESSEKRQLEQMHAENVSLISRITQLNHCISTLNLGRKFDGMIASMARRMDKIQYVAP